MILLYHMHATVTEDIIGYTIRVDVDRHSGRSHRSVFSETWLVTTSEEVKEQATPLIEVLLHQVASRLSVNLRRVATGESPSSG